MTLTYKKIEKRIFKKLVSVDGKRMLVICHRDKSPFKYGIYEFINGKLEREYSMGEDKDTSHKIFIYFRNIVEYKKERGIWYV